MPFPRSGFCSNTIFITFGKRANPQEAMQQIIGWRTVRDQVLLGKIDDLRTENRKWRSTAMCCAVLVLAQWSFSLITSGIIPKFIFSQGVTHAISSQAAPPPLPVHPGSH